MKIYRIIRAKVPVACGMEGCNEGCSVGDPPERAFSICNQSGEALVTVWGNGPFERKLAEKLKKAMEGN